MKRFLLPALLAAASSLFAQGSLDEAVSLLRRGDFRGALPALKTLSQDEGCDPAVFGYLGCACYETGDFAAARECFLRMCGVKFSDKAVWLFNAGNAAAAEKDFDGAEELFSRSLSENGDYGAARLNRANLRVRVGRFDDARADYAAYLEANPQDAQAEKIAAIIAAIDGRIRGDDAPADESLDDAPGDAEIDGGPDLQNDGAQTQDDFQEQEAEQSPDEGGLQDEDGVQEPDGGLQNGGEEEIGE